MFTPSLSSLALHITWTIFAHAVMMYGLLMYHSPPLTDQHIATCKAIEAVYRFEGESRISNLGLVKSSKPRRKGRLMTWAAQFQMLHPLLSQHLPHLSLLRCKNVGYHVVLWAWCRNIVFVISISHPKLRWPSRPRRMRHTWWNEWPEDRLWAQHGTSTYALVTFGWTVLGGVLANYIYSNAISNHFKSQTIIRLSSENTSVTSVIFLGDLFHSFNLIISYFVCCCRVESLRAMLCCAECWLVQHDSKWIATHPNGHVEMFSV